jgi:hypothetical protein
MDDAMNIFDAALDIFEAEQVVTLSSSLGGHPSKQTSGTRSIITLYTIGLSSLWLGSYWPIQSLNSFGPSMRNAYT